MSINRKPRILLCGEFSGAASGYGAISRELLSRWHKSGKYEVAELASGCSPETLEQKRPPWRVYPVLPSQNDKEGQEAFGQDPLNAFGKYIFEQVCLNFRPDYICAMTDPWMHIIPIINSAFRDFFKVVYQAPVDGEPQNAQWLSTYNQCDHLLTYTDWGADLLRKQMGDDERIKGAAYLCADTNVFRPVKNKGEIRDKLGIDPNINLVGMVARNQVRKDFDSLMSIFRKFLDAAPPQMSANTYLYIHTSLPDFGWSLHSMLGEYGLHSRVLWTYRCSRCHFFFPDFYKDVRCYCKRCGAPTAHMTGPRNGISNQELALVYNLMDVYCQFAFCFTGNTKILTINGWKEIKNITVGDMVMTHNSSWQPVLRTMSRTTKEIFNISIYNDYEIVDVTGEHPFYAITKSQCPTDKMSLRESIGEKIRTGRDIPQPDFVKVRNLQNGDLLVYPIDDRIEDIDRIDLMDYIDNIDGYRVVGDKIISVNNGYTINRYIDVDDEFCEFIGLFAADGGVNQNHLSIISNNKDVQNIELSKRVMSRIGSGHTTEYQYEERNACAIFVNSTILSRVFLQWFSKHNNKQLPDWAMLLPVSKQQYIITGMFRGDGHWSDNNECIYYTISPILSDQLKHLLRRSRVNFSVKKLDRLNEKDGKSRQPCYRLSTSSNIIDREFKNGRSNTRGLYYNNWHLIQIKNIQVSYEDVDVYNIEVRDDNSYITKISAVHNCEGFGIPVVEAAACGLSIVCTDYSGLEDFKHTLNATPIPPKAMKREPETGRYWAMVDQDIAVAELIKFFELPPILRNQRAQMTRALAERNYQWDNTSSIFEEIFDSMPLRDWSETWESPSRVFQPQHPPQQLAQMSPSDVVKWCIINILGKPEWVNGNRHLEIEQKLSQGMSISRGMSGANVQGYNPNNAIQYFMGMRQYMNQWEQERVKYVQNTNNK